MVFLCYASRMKMSAKPGNVGARRGETSSTPGNAATFSGGNVAVFITDPGVTLYDELKK